MYNLEVAYLFMYALRVSLYFSFLPTNVEKFGLRKLRVFIYILRLSVYFIFLPANVEKFAFTSEENTEGFETVFRRVSAVWEKFCRTFSFRLQRYKIYLLLQLFDSVVLTYYYQSIPRNNFNKKLISIKCTCN